MVGDSRGLGGIIDRKLYQNTSCLEIAHQTGGLTPLNPNVAMRRLRCGVGSFGCVKSSMKP
jgi:hypothetical protein